MPPLNGRWRLRVHIVLTPFGTDTMEDDGADGHISAFDFEILRSAFRTAVSEGLAGEAQAWAHAKGLVHELTGLSDVEDSIIERIIRP